MKLSTFDLAIVVGYAIALIIIAWAVSREKAGHDKNSTDYFLASKSLPWWAVGASLIASNISAEQIIGMSGSGFAVGLAIASYEWMAAATLLIVGKFLLPIFLKRGIYTMPQYLEQRYDNRVRTVMSVFWIGVYIFVNLTSILWLGATAVNSLTGLNVVFAMIGLGVFAVAYSLYGGLKAVAFTDILQVVLLVFGGILITWIALNLLGGGNGIIAGFQVMLDQAPEKFDMILSPDNPEYKNLPGISVLVGGMWIMNLSYWGFNQYIIQRALGAKSLDEAQRGIVFAAFIKLFMPIIIVLPGIAAFLLSQKGALPAIPVADQAYPTILGLAPNGVKGLIFAGLLAAIISSVASMMNSISTIFTLDIYKQIKPEADEAKLVWVGRVMSLVAIIIAIIMAKPLLGNFDQAFQYIQEFTGFFTPGICAIFLIGMFWKKATANGALLAAIGSAVFSLLAYQFLPDLPFMDRVGYVFLLCCAVIIVTGLAEKKEQKNAVDLDDVSFKTSTSFNLWSAVITAILIALYAVFW